MIFRILASVSLPISVMLIKKNWELRRALAANMTYSAYLADIINRGEAELSEFDQIILVNMFGATLEEGAE